MKKRIRILCFTLLCPLLLTGCFCRHESWIAADCENPKTCASCGEIEGAAMGHTWLEATFEAPKTCPACGKTEGEALDILDFYPADQSRSEGGEFLFPAEEFPALINHELRDTAYTVVLANEENGEAEYRFVKSGEEDPDITCSISYAGGFTEGSAMYMFIHMNLDTFPSQARYETYYSIMGAAFRAVHISAEKTTYDTLMEASGSDVLPEENFSGIIDDVGYSVSFEDDQIIFMILLSPKSIA